MLRLTQKTASGTPAGTLTLPLEQRIKSRLRAELDDGREVGLFLERGIILRDGDMLQAEDGTVIQIRAADETVSTAKCDDPLLLARACYHLGNRHIPLQIDTDRVRYQHDHVLDDMLRKLGLAPIREQAPFDPEPGAYGDFAHAHGHSH